jgi:polysaccharide biosynthesis protein PelE
VSEERKFANAGQAGVITAVAAALEFAIAYFWLTGKLPAGLALAAHVAVSVVVALWARFAASARHGEIKDARLPLLVAISIAALGPLGAGGNLLTLLLARRYMRLALPFEEWYRSLLPDTSEAGNRRILNRLAAVGDGGKEAGGKEALASFADVLAFGSVSQKQDLIALIGRHFRPAFGPVLKRALSDGHSAIRVQAATAMSKIENALLERTMELTRQVRADPKDTAALRALARHYDESLFCGILDARREEDLIAGALAVYRECLAREPDDVATRLAAGRLLLRSKRFEEAAECFAVTADPGFAKPQALWRMESLFQLGRFAEIRSLARAWASQPESPPDYPVEAVEAVRLWAEAL